MDSLRANHVGHMNTSKYPAIQVKLTGTDGNAYAILGTVSRALRTAGVAAAEVTAFNDEAMSGDYNNLLITCSQWVVIS